MSNTLSSCFRRLLRLAFAEATALVSPGLQPQFILVGGAALERWGRTRQTTDVDIAASVDAVAALIEGARSHPCFPVEVDGDTPLLGAMHYIGS